MGAATIALAAGELFAPQISQFLYGSGVHTDLVRAAFVGLWATMNYDQLTALFRVEERSVSYSMASLANVALTIGITILLVVVLDQGPLGVIVGNFSGTLAVYAVLLAYRRTQLGLEFDRDVFWKMTEWGMPLVPSVIALNAIDFADRIPARADQGPARARPVRDRDADLGRAPLRARRVPHRVARVRVLDPRGQRGAAHLRVRPHLRHVLLVLGRARSRPRRAVDRAPADDAGLLRGRATSCRCCRSRSSSSARTSSS